MKHIFALLILLFLLAPANAQQYAGGMLMGGVIGSGASALGGDSCVASGLTFSWHAENADVTQGTPAGCSYGDTTATLYLVTVSTTQYHDGTHSVLFGPYNTATFDSSGILNPSQGRKTFYIYPTTLGNNDRIFSCEGGAGGTLKVYMLSSDKVRFYYTNSVDTYTIDSTVTLSTNQWSQVNVMWNAGGNPDISIQVCDTNGANCETAQTYHYGFSAISALGSTFYYGPSDGNGNAYYLDGIKIYSTYQ